MAKTTGVTFQQIQKYERGANRISASRLFEIAQALNISTRYFFDKIEKAEFPGETGEAEKTINIFLNSKEGHKIADAFTRINSLKIKRRITELLCLLADDEPENDDTHVY